MVPGGVQLYMSLCTGPSFSLRECKALRACLECRNEKHRNDRKRRNRKGMRMQNRGTRNREKLKEQLFVTQELEYEKWNIIYLLLKGDCQYA